MTVAIKDVPEWGYLRGNIAHAIHSRDGGWTYTLCGTLATGDTPHDIRQGIPGRICRKCRQLLSDGNIRVTPEHLR